jgi:hypothetical protein
VIMLVGVSSYLLQQVHAVEDLLRAQEAVRVVEHEPIQPALEEHPSFVSSLAAGVLGQLEHSLAVTLLFVVLQLEACHVVDAVQSETDVMVAQLELPHEQAR